VTGAERASWQAEGPFIAVTGTRIATLTEHTLETRDLDGTHVASHDVRGIHLPSMVGAAPDGLVASDGFSVFRIVPNGPPARIAHRAERPGMPRSQYMLPRGVAAVVDVRGLYVLAKPVKLFPGCETSAVAGDAAGTTLAIADGPRVRTFGYDGTQLAEATIGIPARGQGAIAADGTVLFALDGPRGGLLVWSPSAGTTEVADIGDVTAIAVGDRGVALGFRGGRIGVWRSIAALGAKRVATVARTPRRCTRPAPAGQRVTVVDVTTGDASVLAPAAAQTVIDAARAAVEQCYAPLLELDPDARGDMAFRLELAVAGTVQTRWVHGVDLDLEQCLNRIVETWRFPLAKAEATTVDATLRFAPP
jgi:hypothetical protein